MTNTSPKPSPAVGSKPKNSGGGKKGKSPKSSPKLEGQKGKKSPKNSPRGSPATSPAASPTLKPKPKKSPRGGKNRRNSSTPDEISLPPPREKGGEAGEAVDPFGVFTEPPAGAPKYYEQVSATNRINSFISCCVSLYLAQPQSPKSGFEASDGGVPVVPSKDSMESKTAEAEAFLSGTKTVASKSTKGAHQL